MTEKEKLPSQVSQIASELSVLLGKMKTVPPIDDGTVEKWEQICLNIPSQIDSGLMKIAVVGAVKSGKSTFVNSLLKGDYLKRGGGVVTSVVTRIRKHSRLKAAVVFKSWDEINERVNEALLFCPDTILDISSPIDLRRRKDKDLLKKVTDGLGGDFPFQTDAARGETVLLNNILQGLALCKDFVQADESVVEFEDDRFKEHQVFAGNPSAAFFVKDVILYIDSQTIDDNIEIADCQGTDSADPCQLANVLDYLDSSNMILYIVSSRTGFREADMKFLSIINEMGLKKTVLFIINHDLSEHDSLDDFLTLKEKTVKEFQYFGPETPVFSFSCLYNLFSETENNLSVKERMRLEQWRTETEAVRYSDRNFETFSRCFRDMVSRSREALLLSNHAGKMKSIADGIVRKADVYNRILSNALCKTKADQKRINDLRQGLERIEILYESALETSVDAFKEKLLSRISRRLKAYEVSILSEVKNFIANFPTHSEKRNEQITPKEMPTVTYFLYHEFKTSVERFMVHTVNPKIIKAFHEQEAYIEEAFKSFYDSYKTPVAFVRELTPSYPDFVENLSEDENETGYRPDIREVKTILGLRPAPVRFIIRHTARMRLVTMAGVGMQSMLSLFRELADRKFGVYKGRTVPPALLHIKNEAFKSIKAQIISYNERLSNHYFSSLLEALSRDFAEQTKDQFKKYDLELQKIASIVSDEHAAEKNHEAAIRAMGKEAKAISARLDFYMGGFEKPGS